ncbi:MAG TPA: phosphoribosylanthranilate isomerase [Stenomitos sp.]
MYSPLRVKICGLAKAEQALAIADLGADALGFICVPESPRYVTPDCVAAIVECLPLLSRQGNPLVTIGVFANAPLEQIVQTVRMASLRGVQLHGQESPEFCDRLRTLLPEVELIKAFRIRDAASLALLQHYDDKVDTYLLDAFSTQALGGTGETWNWELLQEQPPQRPWILAGGLTPENVLEALDRLSPPGIDLASGVELSPGHKDLAKAEQLFKLLGRHSVVCS